MAKMPDQAANLDQASAIINDWETGESLSGSNGKGNQFLLKSGASATRAYRAKQRLGAAQAGQVTQAISPRDS
jgi:hypothetical protein